MTSDGRLETIQPAVKDAPRAGREPAGGELVAGPLDADRWDRYVSRHPHGHHEQCSRFAAMRAGHGFESLRIGVTEDDWLVGGAQVLFRRVPLVGRLALVSQGPLVDGQRRDAGRAVACALNRLARAHRLARLRIVSYSSDDFWSDILPAFGFRRAGYRWAPRTTLRVRCQRGDEAILAGMKSKCRYNLRLSIRRGVTVRVGSENDVPLFYRLLRHTARRQGFPTFPLEYFQSVWKLFAPRNKLRLFIAGADGQPLAGVVATVAGDTVSYGWGGLSPERTNLMASYAAHWEAIRWARSVGCEFYDLAGGGGDDSVDRFKSKWGGETAACPDPLEKHYGPLGGLRRRGAARVWDNPRLRELASQVDYRLTGPLPY